MYKNAPKKLQYSKNPRINPRIYLRLKFIYLFMIYIHLFICNLSLTAVPLFLRPLRLAPAICWRKWTSSLFMEMPIVVNKVLSAK